MTFTELQNQTLLFLGVSSVTNSGVTEVEVQACINRVMPMIASEIEDLLTFCEYTTVAGTQQYAIPQHYLTVKMVRLETATGNWEQLTPQTVRQFEDVSYGHTTEQSTPEYYKIERWATSVENDPQLPGDLWLFPVPDAIYKLQMYYYQRPTELTTSGQIPELPIHWHMTIPYRAAEILAIKKKDYELARMMRQLGDIEVEKAKSAAGRPSRDSAQCVQDSGYIVEE